MIKLNSFVTGLILARGQGLDTNRASKVALVTGFLGTTATSLILTNEMAKREAASAAVVTSAQTASTPTVSPEPECCKKLGKRIDNLDIDGKIEIVTKDLYTGVAELKGRVSELEKKHSTTTPGETEDPEEQKQKQKQKQKRGAY